MEGHAWATPAHELQHAKSVSGHLINASEPGRHVTAMFELTTETLSSMLNPLLTHGKKKKNHLGRTLQTGPQKAAAQADDSNRSSSLTRHFWDFFVRL